MKKILALILAVVLVLPLASCKKKKNKDDDKPTDPVAELTPLYELDLSGYVEIDEKYYKNYTVEIKVNSVTDEDVNEAIDQVLDSKQSLLPGTTPIKSGAGIIAYRSGAKVLPVCIKTKGIKYRIFRRIDLIIGKPIENSELGFKDGGTAEYRGASEHAFDQICALGGYEK